MTIGFERQGRLAGGPRRLMTFAIIVLVTAGLADFAWAKRRAHRKGAAAAAGSQAMTSRRATPAAPNAPAAKKVRAARGDKSDHTACVAAYNRSQEESASAHFREARESLSVCAKAACGEAISRECTRLYKLTDGDLPTVVPVATDTAGNAVEQVQVKMDGEVVASKLDGRPLEINPGTHEFSFSTDGGTFATRKVLIVQGQHNRTIAVRLNRAAGPSRVSPTQ